jgi:hypothetical protein
VKRRSPFGTILAGEYINALVEVHYGLKSVSVIMLWPAGDSPNGGSRIPFYDGVIDLEADYVDHETSGVDRIDLSLTKLLFRIEYNEAFWPVRLALTPKTAALSCTPNNDTIMLKRASKFLQRRVFYDYVDEQPLITVELHGLFPVRSHAGDGHAHQLLLEPARKVQLAVGGRFCQSAQHEADHAVRPSVCRTNCRSFSNRPS